MRPIHIVKEPTCHTKGNKPNVIDVILTNKTNLCTLYNVKTLIVDEVMYTIYSVCK